MLYALVMVGSFLTVVFISLLVYNAMFSSRLAVLNRLQTHTMDDTAIRQVEGDRAKGFREDFLGMLGALGKIFPRTSYLEPIQKKLIQAHIFMRAEEFLGLSFLVGGAVFLLFYLLAGNFLYPLPLGIISLKIPELVVNNKKKRRMEALGQQLPEALGIISNGLRAGFSFPQAMAIVGKEMTAPISEEFNRVIRENRLGKPLEEALSGLTERTDNDDLDMFVTALIIQRQVGGNLAEILDNISHTIRERVKIKGEIKTLTAQGKLSAIIISLLPVFVGTFISIFNPEYMLTLVQDPAGIIFLTVAIILLLVGIYLISKIVNIEV